MLLKIFQQRFAYDLCNVASCLVSFKSVSPKCVCHRAEAYVNTTERNTILHINSVFRVTNGVDKVSIQQHSYQHAV